MIFIEFLVSAKYCFKCFILIYLSNNTMGYYPQFVEENTEIQNGYRTIKNRVSSSNL